MRQPRYHFKIDYGKTGVNTTKSRTLKTVLRHIDDELESHRQEMTEFPDKIIIVITRDREDNS